MLLLAAILLASTEPAAAPAPSTGPVRHARATVRIVRPASLRVGSSETLEGVPLRDTRILESNGEFVPAKLAEFE